MADAHFRPGGQGLDRPMVATTHGDWIEREMIVNRRPLIRSTSIRTTFAGWRPYTVVGEASDGNAWHGFGGIAGHAGLFASAADLVALGRGILDSLGRQRPLVTVYCGGFPAAGPGSRAGRGIPALAEYGAIGHTGFTAPGSPFFPALERIAVLLTNRTHTADRDTGDGRPGLGGYLGRGRAGAMLEELALFWDVHS